MNVNTIQANAATTSTVSPSGSTATPATGTSSVAAATAGTLGPNDFITLLAAQLQSQDPFNPIDPTTFVNQLVQFNTLEQVIQIQQDVSTLTGANTAAGPTPGTSTTGTGTNP